MAMLLYVALENMAAHSLLISIGSVVAGRSSVSLVHWFERYNLVQLVLNCFLKCSLWMLFFPYPFPLSNMSVSNDLNHPSTHGAFNMPF